MFDYSGYMAPVTFVADLHEADGQLSGLAEEVDDMFDGKGPVFLAAVLVGSRQQCHVEFVKTYDEFDPICVVDYHGTVDEDSTEISGDWVRRDDGMAGSFVMRRKNGGQHQVEKRASVEQPA